MSYIYGKISRKVSKQGKDYFVGMVGNVPVRAAWGKDKPDDICLFLDVDMINFLDKKKNTDGKTAVQEENQH